VAPPRKFAPAVVLAVVGYSVFVAADDLTVVTTMLRPITNDLGLVLPDGLDDAAWIVNVYLIAFVAVMPIAGRLSDVIGRRETFVGAYLLFLVGTTAIPLTSQLGPFLAARVLTALGGGAMVPVALAVVGDVHPEASRARALGTLGAIETMGWVWGPLYGAVLVRFLSWRWQFWLNIPLALVGLIAVWWVLDGHEQPHRRSRVDWVGALALTAALVSVNLALLGNAEIQSVTGLDELRGAGSGFDFRWLYLVAAPAVAFLVWHQRRATSPLIDRRLFEGRTLRIALAVNFVVGALLVIAMVDVPIFVNAVEVDLERSAVIVGWILSAMTASMALTSYLGGRFTERTWYRPPVLAGLSSVVAAYLMMGYWQPGTSSWTQAAHLALLGAGLGLVVAPTTSAVVDSTPPEDRGAAAGVVMVVRLIGLSAGLSALTAYGLGRYNALRQGIELPDLTDPGFEDALRSTAAQLTADALGETFLASAAIAGFGLVLAALLRRGGATGVGDLRTRRSVMSDIDRSSRIDRHLRWFVGGVAVAVVVVLVGVGLVAARLEDTRDELARTRADLERVEGGAALFASQVRALEDQLLGLGPTLSDGLDEAITGLEEFQTSTIDFTVDIDQDVTIDTEVVLDRTVVVPIDESLPIAETVETTIEVRTPLGFSVPVDVTVPVAIEVPVRLDLDVPINEAVPIVATVPVQLRLPVVIDVADTEFADLARSLADGLRALRDLLGA
jgi:MFS family permease